MTRPGRQQSGPGPCQRGAGADLQRAALPAASVDCFYSVDTLEHIPRDRLQGIFTVVVAGGPRIGDLYIGVFAKDPEPAKIIVNELRKDFNTGSADGFQVVIDTFKDERNGYQFAVTQQTYFQ